MKFESAQPASPGEPEACPLPRVAAIMLRTPALAVVLGRTAAACAHPIAAWRASLSWRVLAIAGYSAASYLIVLSALFAFS